jgi:hypothetical protein
MKLGRELRKLTSHSTVKLPSLSLDDAMNGPTLWVVRPYGWSDPMGGPTLWVARP